MDPIDDSPLIASPKTTQHILHEYQLTAKKSLGQNFLVDRNVLRKIVSAAEITSNHGVIEIGPGIGSLTQQLALSAGKVVAIELDRKLAAVLQKLMAPYRNVEIIQADFLKLDLPALFQTRFSECTGISVAANLPYYITTPIVMKLLEQRLGLDHIVIMLQKEVAQRMTASPGNKTYGSLSIAVQYYCRAQMVSVVPPTVFIPRPAVESAVIKLTPHQRPPIFVQDETFFFQVVQAGFAQRRKTIINNLAARFAEGRDRASLLAVLRQCGIDPSRRAETLDIEQFSRLSNALIAIGCAASDR